MAISANIRYMYMYNTTNINAVLVRHEHGSGRQGVHYETMKTVDLLYPKRWGKAR